MPRSRNSFRPVFSAVTLLLWMLAASCSKDGVLPVARGNTSGPAANGPPPVPVAVVPSALGAISRHYFATATLEPNKEAGIVARVSGVVLGLSVEEGDVVRPGTVLLRIEEDAYLQRLRQAEAEQVKQRDRFERQKKMFEKDLVSAEDYDAARTDLQAAEASRELAALELSHARVETPFAGHVVLRSVDPGQMVNAGSPLFTVADLSRLLARVHVPAKEFRNIRVGQPVTLTLDSDKTVLDGEIILVSPVIDASSGTIKVTVAVSDYPERTRPGDFAEVRIETDRRTDTLLVPGAAVFTDRGDSVVYTAVDEKACRRVVRVGFQDEVHAEILEGLSLGEAVVIQGQRSLSDGQPVKILDEIRFEDDVPRQERS